MQIEYFYYLSRLVEEGSLTKAASSLYISPQGLSKAMQKMSEELGFRLFYHDKSRLRLTAEGNEVYKAAKQITEINENMIRRLGHFYGKGADQEIVIYASSHQSIAFLYEAIIRFQKQRPEIKPKLIELPMWELGRFYSPIKDNEVRFISFVESLESEFISKLDGTCEFHELGRGEVMCRFSVESDLSKKRFVTQQDVSDRSIALFADEAEVAEELLGVNVGSQVMTTVSNYSLLCDIIANDEKMVGITNSVIEKNQETTGLCAVPLHPSTYIIYGYIVRKDGEVDPAVNDLLEIARDYFDDSHDSSRRFTVFEHRTAQLSTQSPAKEG